ncbi:MAG: iron-sulfur cluster assembly scaffold protein [Spirochaetales bacterium]|nr:iron-sulfur cluster assembly scaffold protein [Spirochaetales bacterium]
MSDWLYSPLVKEHFMNPKNILEDEAAFHADGSGMVGNIKCGDQMLIVIRVENDIITDCKWKTYGCASAIASTSMLSEVVKGMSLKDAYTIKPEQIVDKLGGLPEHKFHCSVLGDKALRAAIDDYYRTHGREGEIPKEKAVVICQCMNVTDKDIEEAVQKGVATYQQLQEHTKLGTVCGKCRTKAEELLHQFSHLYG